MRKSTNVTRDYTAESHIKTFAPFHCELHNFPSSSHFAILEVNHGLRRSGVLPTRSVKLSTVRLWKKQTVKCYTTRRVCIYKIERTQIFTAATAFWLRTIMRYITSPLEAHTEDEEDSVERLPFPTEVTFPRFAYDCISHVRFGHSSLFKLGHSQGSL